MKHAVENRAGQVACKGWATFGQAYVAAYGPGFKWRDIRPDGQLPDDTLTWTTHAGALRFAAMNGGAVISVTETSDAPVNTASP